MMKFTCIYWIDIINLFLKKYSNEQIIEKFFFIKLKNPVKQWGLKIRRKVVKKVLKIENWSMALYQAVGCNNLTVKNKDDSFF